MSGLITIIIPVYNVEKYLSKCVDSVLMQTYRNIEIILVDDGSSDDSGKICDIFGEKDKRVKVIHKKNEGVSVARNVALAEANGEYIAFVDGDDFILSNCIESMYNLIEDSNVDIVQLESKFYFENDNVRSNKVINNDENKVIKYTQKEAVIDLLKLNKLTQTVWGKLYRKDVIKNIDFPKGRVICEDFEFVCKAILNAKYIIYNSAPLYMYRIREDSIMQSSFDVRWLAELEVTDDLMRIVNERYSDLINITQSRRLISYFKTLYRILSSTRFFEKKYLEKDIKNQIFNISKEIEWKKDISNTLRVKIFTLKISKWLFFVAQNISDKRKQRKYGHKFIP